MSTTLFVPTLNEIEGMKQIMPQVDPRWVEDIIIVDGGSTDGTIEYAREKGYKVYVQKKKGIRYAYIEAFPLIKTEYVITFSPDGNSPTYAIPKLIEKIKEGYDMVIASRYLPPAKSYDDDIFTKFGNCFFRNSINLMYRAKYTDPMVIYRIYRTELFYKLALDEERSYWPENLLFTRLGIEPLLSIRVAKAKLRYTEIPVEEPKRVGGERKLQIIRWGLGYFLQVIGEKIIYRDLCNS